MLDRKDKHSLLNHWHLCFILFCCYGQQLRHNFVSWIEDKMKKYIFLLLTLIFIFISCTKDHNIITPIDTDAELQKKLIGTWISIYNTHTTTYYSNSTFVDSMFSAVDSIRYGLYLVAKGNFTIKDSVLIKSNIIIEFVDSSHFLNNGLNYLFSSKYLKFSNNSFEEYYVDDFETIEVANNDIWRNWMRIVWIYNLSFSEPTYLGRIKTFIDFDKNTQRAKTWNEYLDNNNNAVVDTFYSDVNFSNSILNLPGFGIDSIPVSFNGNKMFFWYSYEPFRFFRKS